MDPRFDNGYDIPPPVMCNIVSRFSVRELFVVRLVCKEWCRSSKSPVLITDHTKFARANRSKHLLLCGFFYYGNNNRQLAFVDKYDLSYECFDDFIDLLDFVLEHKSSGKFNIVMFVLRTRYVNTLKLWSFYSDTMSWISGALPNIDLTTLHGECAHIHDKLYWWAIIEPR
ncbi:uncharacterized protein G2W53_032883 [Senna tora]|uniref:F-box domain-containing protein n=1 Tax=Senna tora TaxID=362788 RepID=A0A834T178_9FABA|nr:uncharacterized protein G2W53_032883 [Senna tora]